MNNNKLLKLQTNLVKHKLDALLVSSSANIIYLTHFSNFSKEEREAYLLITPKKAFVITDARYTEAATKLMPDFKLIERSVKNPLSKIFEKLKKDFKINKLGFEENNITVSEYKLLKKYFKLQHSSLIETLRIVKSKEEIYALKKACELGDKTFKYILTRIKKGATEQEIAGQICEFIRKNGGDISFSPIVAFSENSSDIHHAPTNKKLVKNSFVLLDFGAKVNNYCSDMTRTLFFGEANEKQKKMHNTVLAAQQKAIDFITSKLKIRTSSPTGVEVDKIARNYIAKHGFPPYPHGLGHGIGLLVHEKPTLAPLGKNKIEQGMVFSIEPGIYIPGFGGVRIEDLVAVVDGKIELLTKSPRNFIEI